MYIYAFIWYIEVANPNTNTYMQFLRDWVRLRLTANVLLYARTSSRMHSTLCCGGQVQRRVCVCVPSESYTPIAFEQGATLPFPSKLWGI